MNIYLITYQDYVLNENQLINQLFENGLQCLHIRKPNSSLDETEKFLLSIHPKFYSKIALHQHHQLAERYPIKRLHYTETERKKASESDLLLHKNNSVCLSTSIHKIEDYKKISSAFNHCFLGPVFDSISKPSYSSTINPNFVITEYTNTKLIAIGGIEYNNIKQIKEMGFQGIALLGSIWKKDNPVEAFKQIKLAWAKNEVLS